MLASKEEIKIQQAVVHILDSALGMPLSLPPVNLRRWRVLQVYHHLFRVILFGSYCLSTVGTTDITKIPHSRWQHSKHSVCRK